MQATYYDGKSATAQSVHVGVVGGRLTIELEQGATVHSHPLADVKVEERLNNGPRVLSLPAQATLELRSTSTDEWLIRIGLVKPKGEWLHSKAVGVLGAAFAVLLALAILLKLWIPEISRHVAKALPDEWAEVTGEAALANLDEHWFAPTELGKAEQQRLQNLFNSLKNADHQRLVLRKSKIGPNAVALTDGTVVLTDELVRWLQDDQAIAGVLLHELGHIKHQHGMRALVQNGMGLAVASVVFGDVSVVLAAAANQLTQVHYSREFEREADQYAIAEFQKRGLPLEKLLVLHEKVMEASNPEGGTEKQTSSYWDTHPHSQERIDMIRAHLPKQGT